MQFRGSWRKMAPWILSSALILAGCGSAAGRAPAQPQAAAQPPAQPPAPAPAPAPAPPPLQKVRFSEVIRSLFYAPQYVAEAKGFFKAEGVDLDTSTAQGSDKGTAALLAGTADVALVGPETTVFVYNQDTPNKVKLFAQLTARDGSFLMARKPNPAFKWEETRGKSIVGWRQGSMPQMVATAVLRQSGVAPGKDVNYITNLAAPAMAGAFQSGQGEYIQLFEPVVSLFEKDGTAHVVASLGKAYGPLPYTGYVATDRYIAQHPEVIQRFTNAIYRAMLYVQRTDPQVVAREIAPFFAGTDVALIASAIKRYKEQDTWKDTPVMDPRDYDKLQALMVEGGVLEPARKAPFAMIAVNTFAERAVREIK